MDTQRKTISDNKKKTDLKLKYLFENSVKKHLISDRKIGLFLSGGTDSSILANQILKSKKNIDSFTYDFDRSGRLGESVNAKLIADKLKIKNFNTVVNSKYVLNNFEKMINIIESPLTSIRLFGVLKNYELAKKKNYKVILEGHGGDEQFGGYKYNYIFYVIDEFRKNRNKNVLIEKLLFNKYYKKVSSKEIINTLITSTYQNGSTTDGTSLIDLNFFKKDFLNNIISEEYYLQKK